MQNNESIGFRLRIVWFLALVLASTVMSFAFACAMPLAAIAAIAVLTQSRGVALAAVCTAVLANQCVGFAALHYPLVDETFAWGAVFLAVGVLAVFGAGWIKDRFAMASLLSHAAVFLTAFALYEGTLFLISVVTGSYLGAYAPSIISHIFVINAATFVGLLGIHYVLAHRRPLRQMRRLPTRRAA